MFIVVILLKLHNLSSVLGNIVTTGLVDGVDFAMLVENAVTLDGVQTITGTHMEHFLCCYKKYFLINNFLINVLFLQYNKQTLSCLLVFKIKSTNFFSSYNTGAVTFEGPVVFSEVTSPDVNNVNFTTLENNAVRLYTNEEITGHKTFTK